jgi:hypothetical protein
VLKDLAGGGSAVVRVGARNLGVQGGFERCWGPFFGDGLAEQVGLGLGCDAVDRLVTVEIGREGVTLGGGGDDVVQVAVGRAGRFLLQQYREKGPAHRDPVDGLHGAAER